MPSAFPEIINKKETLMKIFTSYYANRALKNFSPDALRSISEGLPREMTCTQVKEFAPDWSTVKAYKDGAIDWADYTAQYTAKLNALGITKIMPLLVDGCVYLGTSLQSVVLGRLVSINWSYWPLFIIPFTIIGLFLAIRIWAAYPKSETQ